MRAPITLRMRRPRKSARPRPDCDKQVMLPDRGAARLDTGGCPDPATAALHWAVRHGATLGARAERCAGMRTRLGRAAAGAERRDDGGDRPARRRSPDAGRQQPGHPPSGGVRLCAPGRLRPRSQPRAGHPERGRGRGRPRVHAAAARGASLVGRRAVHDRGFPLLLGGRRQQREAQSLRAAPGVAGRRRVAAGRDPGSRSRSATAGPRRTPSSCRRWPAPDRCSSTCPRTI